MTTTATLDAEPPSATVALTPRIEEALLTVMGVCDLGWLV